MKIEPLCSDSMGVRSMATLVETRDLKLIIDPAAAVAPRRYGLPPHRKELELLEEYWKKIASVARDCEVIVVTHYHYDHHSSARFLEEIYGGRIVIVKDPENMINFNQRTRARIFLEKIRPIAAQVLTADGREYFFGETSLEFSRPVPHGPDDHLGYVVELRVKDSSQSFLFTSDVQGFPLDSQIKFVIDKKPDVIFVDGPSTYMLGINYPVEALEASLRNIVKTMREAFPSTIILDHHLLRDLEWKKHLKDLLKEAEKIGVDLKSTAEYLNVEINQLEALRGSLYGLRI
ncbi:MAG: MBL fold metallo-hydrolase [Candidatus Brockarchaeota archaeon]|nr:MBL fold metallo-hydrolase [Candidatus Brockarchaeota archaeon]